MSYNQSATSLGMQASPNRIAADVNTINNLADRIRSCMARNINNARILGYYEPQPASTGSTPTPVISNLSDAIRDLDRAVDELSASFNIFD